jgi:hypothetical protein
MSLSGTKSPSSPIDPPATGDVFPGYKDQIRNHAAASASAADTATTADTTTATADQHRQRMPEGSAPDNRHQSSTTMSKTDVVGPSYKDQMRGALVATPLAAIPLAKATPVTGSRLQLEQQNLELQQELERQQQPPQPPQPPADSSSNGSCSLSKTQMDWDCGWRGSNPRRGGGHGGGGLCHWKLLWRNSSSYHDASHPIISIIATDINTCAY